MINEIIDEILKGIIVVTQIHIYYLPLVLALVQGMQNKQITHLRVYLYQVIQVYHLGCYLNVLMVD